MTVENKVALALLWGVMQGSLAYVLSAIFETEARWPGVIVGFVMGVLIVLAFVEVKQ